MKESLLEHTMASAPEFLARVLNHHSDLGGYAWQYFQNGGKEDE